MSCAMPSPRRFPPPWSIEELNNACFIVRDHDGQRLVYVYFEDEPAAISGEIIGAGRSETNCCQHCEIAGAIEPP